LFLSAFSMRAFFSDPLGNEPFFHLIRSDGLTFAVRASAASGQSSQAAEYAATALFLFSSDAKLAEGSGQLVVDADDAVPSFTVWLLVVGA
jgi:hypothetical protein